MTGELTRRMLLLNHELRTEEIPLEVKRALTSSVLDYLGVLQAGARALRPNLETWLDLLREDGGRAAVVGTGRRTSVVNAALLNGMSAHFFELDDGSRFGMVHPGAPVLSALFAIAQSYDISADSFLRGMLVGYEFTLRLASAIQPSHKKRGFHATGTCGSVGVALAVAAALELDESTASNIISAAAASASGLLEMIEDTSELKPFNAGKAAQNGLVAALTGGAGFHGPEDPVGGKRGFVKAFADGFDEAWLERNGDRRYVLLGIYRKPYASCRHCHSAVEAALKLREDGVLPDKIERIQVSTYSLAVGGHDHTHISGPGSAKMSIPYSVAAAFVLGDGGIAAMSEEAVRDAEILDLTRRVSVREEPEYSALAPGKRIARLTATTVAGDDREYTVTYPRGEPENAMSDEELVQKFDQLMKFADVGPEVREQIRACVENWETGYPALLGLLK